MPNNGKMDKWVIQKNNKGWERHKVYVAFVILFKKNNGDYPTEKQYLDDIVPYLIKTGVNKKGKKTAEYHQLYSPVFYGFLRYNKGKIEPTDLGLIILLDAASIFRFTETLLMFMENTTLGNEASGSDIKYNKIMPLREVLENLVRHNEISYDDLNKKFIYEAPGTDIKTIASSINPKKDPKWEYALKWAEEAGLITTNGNLSNLSRASKGYVGTFKIFPTIELSEQINYLAIAKKELLEKYNISEDDLDIDKMIEIIVPVGNKKNIGRNATDQAAFRQGLLERDKRCIICGISHPLVVTASHILSYELCNKEQQFDLDNGIILCDIHDALFDAGLMTFINGELTFSKDLSKKDREIIELLPTTTSHIFSPGIEKYIVLRNELEFEKFKPIVWAKRIKFKKENIK